MRRALPAAWPRRARPTGRGHAGEAWLVEGPRMPVLAKIALRPGGGGRLANAGAAATRAAAAGVPTPRLLHLDPSCRAFGDRPLAITEYLAGTDGEEALPAMAPEQRAAFFHALGAALGRLHRVPFPGFAPDSLGRDPQPDWAAVVTRRLVALPDRYRAAELELDSGGQEAIARLAAAATALSGLVQPALVHHDIYLANTLVDSGRFAGLLDFEYARCWDPASDFVKPAILVFDANPGARAAMEAGYRTQGPLPPAFGARRHLALGLELVGAIPVFAAWGAQDMVARYRQGLERWLETDGDEG